MNYVYLLRCADGSLYCGWTTDLQTRLKAHNTGAGAKYTRSRRPVELVYSEEYADRHEALSRERHIILTNGFIKKTQKTPPKEIEQAKKYRADYLRRKESRK